MAINFYPSGTRLRIIDAELINNDTLGFTYASDNQVISKKLVGPIKTTSSIQSTTKQLTDLKKLQTDGIITQTEFEDTKKKFYMI